MMTTESTTGPAAFDTDPRRTRRRPARTGGRATRVTALVGIIGGTAVVSSGCSLSDVSAILSILRFLGII